MASSDFTQRARELDLGDPLRAYRAEFFGTSAVEQAEYPGMPVAYFDGNSLGRPLRKSIERLSSFAQTAWGTRLIRSWDEQWLNLPLELGDKIGAAALGAAPGQTFVGDSTSVLIYKMARAVIAARPGRTEIVLDTDNFPTDRYLLEGIADELTMTLRWIEADTHSGVTPEQVAAVVNDNTALVLLSHVAYRSGFMADAPAITQITHDAGALIVWDLSHSVGSVLVELDAWNVDIAVGCSYKYLCGGPGAPAWAYVRKDLQTQIEQPIQGWWGTKNMFMMGPGYDPENDLRRFITGTAPVVSMQAMIDPVELIGSVTMEAIREKSLLLTQFVIDYADTELAELGVTVATPREAQHRGGHVTLNHPHMREVNALLWKEDIIPDYRDPHGLRIGLSPLSTSFEEVFIGLERVKETLHSLG
jgi:kynureninase